MRILVTGATGFIGSRLVAALLAQGHEVVAVSRNGAALRSRFAAATVVQMDFSLLPGAADWERHLSGVDIVFNAVGIIAESATQRFSVLHVEFPRALFRACERAGVKRVIQISALGAAADALSDFHLSKHAADDYLRGLPLASAIVKPSLVFGAGGKSMEFFCALAAQPVQVLIDHGKQRVQPIHIDDLVAILTRLTRIESLPADVAAVGPAPLSFRDMLATYRRWLDLDRRNRGLRVISLPHGVVMFCARLLGFLNNPYLQPDNLRMLRQDNTASPAPSTALLGAPPASLGAALAKTPATDADRWHARLYFLLPLLRCAIAFVWIYTGIISAFVYPAADSYALLRQTGIGGWMLPVSLYGAAALDIIFGIAVLLRYRPPLTGLLQLTTIAVYTIVISVFLPEFWFHPFGPLVKNIPFVLAILMLMAVERK